MWRARWAAVTVIVAMTATACSAHEDSTVNVFAASSLTDVFEQLAADYEAAHPATDIVLSFGGSSSLVAQLGDGAPVDVLATADMRTMSSVDASSIVGTPVVFATNTMVIAVERGNPLDITSITDLADVPVVVLADEQVPAGAYAREVVVCVGVDLAVRSFEQNVRAAAAKVALGEADAAIVYRTDISPDLDVVEIDPACNVRADYPIALIGDSDEAASFFDFVTSGESAGVLAGEGFETP